MNKDYLPFISIIVSIVGLIITYFGFIQKQNDRAIAQSDRLAKLETKVDLFWTVVEKNVGQLLKSSVHVDKDILLDKLAHRELNLPEAEQLSALGVVLLSRGGQFNKYTTYLIGDILAVSSGQIMLLLVMLGVVITYWVVFGNALILTSINPVLASSRGLPVFLLQTSFSVLLALVVTLSIRWVGILLINSLLILPAVSGRILAGRVRSYGGWSVLLAVISGIGGLIISYYWGTSSGATIVLIAAVFYGLAVLVKWITR